MIEKTLPYSDKIHNYSSIWRNPIIIPPDEATISLALTLSYFSLLDIDPFFILVIGPAGCDSCQKKTF